MNAFPSCSLALLFISTVALAADKDPPDLAGTYSLVSGKKHGAEPDAEAKKAEYVITKSRFTITGKDAKFVIEYTLNPKASPIAIDMKILEGPEGTAGSKAQGIVQKDGDELKLAYSLENNKRPKDFEGKDGMLFVFKKTK